MIFCCGVYRKPDRLVSLISDENYRDKRLEIAVCPICGALIAQLTQFDVKLNKFVTIRPPAKKTGRFLKRLESLYKGETEIKYGTKGNAGFVYGENKEIKGKIYQYAVDFNGQKKLVKII